MPRVRTLEEYEAFITDRCLEIQRDLAYAIRQAMFPSDSNEPAIRDDFKGASFTTTRNGVEYFLNFKEGIGFKVTIELDHRPLDIRKGN